MKNLAMFVSFGLCLFVGSANAQRQVTVSPSSSPGMNGIVPMLKAQLEALGSPELLEAQAKYFRELYLSLKKQGFSDEQAMQIVVALASSRNSN